MGCIHSLDQSSVENGTNTKKHHRHHNHIRCATSPPPSESISSLHNRNISGIIHYKPRELLITDDSMQQELPNTNDLQNKLRKMMFTNSNSVHSVISNTATTWDCRLSSQHTPQHTPQHSRITLNYTMDDSHHIPPNESPPPPLTLENHISHISNTPIMRSAPIFAYKKRTASFKRSRSVDPPPNPSIAHKKKHKRTRTHHINKYAYTQQKNGKINTTKSKRRLVHAKSKSIPYNIFSSDLNKYQSEETDNYQYLSQVTHFDQNTLRLLHLRFNHIYLTSLGTLNMEDMNDTSHNHKSRLDVAAISHIFGLPPHCILVQRFFRYMDQQGLGELSFRVFARTMSLLSDKASVSEKCELSFHLYDLNDDHVIDRNELKQVIYDLMHCAKHLMDPLLIELMSDKSCDFIRKLINDTMKMFDLDSNGNITYRSYCKFMAKHPRLLSPFTLDIEKLLEFEAEKRRMHRISLKSLEKKQLRQLVIGMDPKLKYNKKWKKPQFIKDMEKDQVQHVNTIKSPQQICRDLCVMHDNGAMVTASPTTDDEKEKEKEERLQRTIDFLYDD